MPKNTTNLTARFVETVSSPGRYYDGHGTGMFLLVKPSGSKSYVQRLSLRGKELNLGLGSTRLVTLRQARDAAHENQKKARKGIDPRADRARSKIPSFKEAVDIVIGIHAVTWKNSGKSEAQWRASLRDYAFPRIGNRLVSDITTADVMGVLLPIWNEKRETARRVRQRIGAVMKWAVAQEYRQDNPAGDAIGAALPKNGVQRKHMAFIHYSEVSKVLDTVKSSNAWACTKLAIEFVAYTACRSNEVRGARWDEVDIKAKTWTIPPERMKAKREHVVPLSDQAIEVLHEVQQYSGTSDLVFPSLMGKVMSDSTMSKLIREIGYRDVCTIHGLRSSFRVWCSETGQNTEAAELCLAHVNPNKVEAAYQRSSLLELRRKVMQKWTNYLAK